MMIYLLLRVSIALVNPVQVIALRNLQENMGNHTETITIFEHGK